MDEKIITFSKDAKKEVLKIFGISVLDNGTLVYAKTKEPIYVELNGVRKTVNLQNFSGISEKHGILINDEKTFDKKGW